MRVLQRMWHYLLAEPFTWIFYCFFQPLRFALEYGQEKFPRRLNRMLRLLLPMFLLAYPLALLLYMLLRNPVTSKLYLPTNISITGLLLSIAFASLLALLGGFLGGLLGDVRIGIVLGIALGITGIVFNQINIGLTKGVAIAIALGLTGGLIGGTTWRMQGGLIGGFVGGAAWTIAGGSAQILEGLWVASTFFLAYMLGYYRIPLYLVSASSLLRVHLMSARRPKQVFTHLQRSALYWDECVYLPLPGLPRILLRAVEQNTKQAQEQIVFILTQRPQQRSAVRAALLEIVIHDQEMRTNLQEVALSWSDLNDILPQDEALMDPQWLTSFARLSDASRDAARYCSSLEMRVKRAALSDMITNLKNIHPNIISGDEKQSQRLAGVVNRWLEIAQREQEILDQAPQDIGQIDNPFSPGAVLKPQDSLFVGRRDLVKMLAEALSKESGRPTFFLTGERRMGKSSTLKQLPHLLGARYIPITYDLQTTGVTSSASAFLANIARAIYTETNVRGLTVKRLKEDRLTEAERKNEAAAYNVFNDWLLELEQVLERNARTLLLAFDEFEKLEASGRARFLDLRLLLDWFRSIIQNRNNMVLLFSGVRTIDEMGNEAEIRWSSYFVNVQVLKVRFLRPSEARQLITKPKPLFPGADIFGTDVVDEIIRVTGCHPFLIQAICAALIEYLNSENRNLAKVEDVEIATRQIQDKWINYFQDLWQYTEKEQRLCLFTIHSLGQATYQGIAEQVSLDEATLKTTLDTLLKRDLIAFTDNKYHIATPIYEHWIEKYK